MFNSREDYFVHRLFTFCAQFVRLRFVIPECVELEGQCASVSPFGVSVRHRRACSNSVESRVPTMERGCWP